MRVLVIVNLGSGSAGGGIYQFMRKIASDGDEIVVRSTDGTTDLRTFLTDVAEFDLVVPCGGDGTVAMVCYETRYSGVPVLPYPAGTANLLTTNNIASPDDPASLAQMAKDMRVLDFDLVELTVGENTFGFDIIAGAGYDAVIMDAAKPSKKAMGPLAYVGAAFTNPVPPTSHFTLTLDGETVEADGMGVLIMNFSKIILDIGITHENTPRDGLLDVVIMKTNNAFELIPTAGAALLDLLGDFPERGDALEVHRCREVSVTADPPLPVQFDGETFDGETPFTARVLPGACKLVLSEKGYDLFKDE